MDDLLFLCHRIPFPPNKGDKIRSYHVLDHLAGRYRVHLGCFYDDPADARHIDALERRCASLLCIPLDRLRARFKSLAGLAARQSLTEVYYRDARLARWVMEVTRQHRLESAYIFGSAMAPYALALGGTRRVFDMVDLDSEKWRAYAATKPWPLSWLYAREQARLFELERRAAAGFEWTLMVSAAEAAVFRRAAPEVADRILDMSNGVDTDFFDPGLHYANPFPSGRRAILFTGAMDYWPNVQAVEWFAQSVLPGLASRRPDLEFWIVGTDPSRRVRRLAEAPGIRVTGRVEDIRPYLAGASVVVAPLQIARGIQNKVLEAMAMAKPVVATPQAAEGILATGDTELILCGSAPDFARGVLAALGADGRELGGRARALVEKRFQWSDRWRRLDALLSPAASRAPSAERSSFSPAVGQ